MNTKKTVSEEVFEAFLKTNNLNFDPIARADTPRPDYIVHFEGFNVVFEIKELSEDDSFSSNSSSRKVGDHIRAKITKAKDQVKYGHSLGFPSVLVIYNDVDPLHLFGTEDHDFTSAMYGEMTLKLDADVGDIIDAYNGRNKSFSNTKRTYFSAVGRLKPTMNDIALTLFENIYSDIPIPHEKLPKFIGFNRYSN